MGKYVSSGKVGMSGFLIVLGAALVAGALAAGAFHFVGRFLYLVILFPILWGAAVGAATAAAVKKGKCRSALAAAGAGLIAAVASYGIYHTLGNLYLREKVRETMAAKFGSKEEFDRAYDENLQKTHGHSGFLGELARRAELGISIRSRSTGSSQKAPSLTGTGVYVYWLVELGILAAVALAIPLVATREPFCERCDVWYEKKDVAGIDPAKMGDAVRVLTARDFGALRPAICADPSSGVLVLEKCPRGCGAPSRVKLVSITRDRRGKKMGRKTVFQDMLETRDAEAIEKAAAKPAASPPVGPSGAGSGAI